MVSNYCKQMKKIIFLLFILIIVSCKKEVFSPDLTQSFSIQSVSNGAEYDIKVAIPENYSPGTQYAAVYVLDGEEIFDFVAKNCNEISSDFSTTNAIVVGIGYGNDRSLDYTPSVADEGDGGAEEFLLFIKNELIPKIENDYSADTLRKSRIILGHSFGGLCATYAFTNHNRLFGNYIILSPSLWYDNEIMLRFEEENRNINRDSHQLVFLGLGELEMGRMLAPFEAFCQRLQINYPDLTIKRHIEAKLSHRGSENPNIVEGLNFYFQNKK